MRRARIILRDRVAYELDAQYDDVTNATRRGRHDHEPITLPLLAGGSVTFNAADMLAITELPTEPWPWGERYSDRHA